MYRWDNDTLVGGYELDGMIRYRYLRLLEMNELISKEMTGKLVVRYL